MNLATFHPSGPDVAQRRESGGEDSCPEQSGHGVGAVTGGDVLVQGHGGKTGDFPGRVGAAAEAPRRVETLLPTGVGRLSGGSKHDLWEWYLGFML